MNVPYVPGSREKHGHDTKTNTMKYYSRINNDVLQHYI